MNLRWTAAILWVCIQFPAGAQVSVSSPVVTVYYSERAPYAIVDGQRGPLLERTKAVLAEAGVRGRFIELPADRIVTLLKAGPVNALGLGWYRMPVKDTWGRFSPAVYQEKPLVAVVNLRSAEALPTPLDLEVLLSSGLTLGTKAGTSVGPALERRIRAQGLVPLETSLAIPGLLKLVAEGRMDYTILAEEEARYLLDRDPTLAAALTVVRFTDPLPGNQRCLFYPEAFDAALAQKIDQAIEKLVPRGAEK